MNNDQGMFQFDIACRVIDSLGTCLEETSVCQHPTIRDAMQLGMEVAMVQLHESFLVNAPAEEAAMVGSDWGNCNL